MKLARQRHVELERQPLEEERTILTNIAGITAIVSAFIVARMLWSDPG